MTTTPAPGLSTGSVDTDHFGNVLVKQRIAAGFAAEIPTDTPVQFARELR